MTITAVIIGGDGEPIEPDWTLTYSDEDDLAIASEQWGQVIREMRDAQVLTVANGHAIRRLVDFRITYERANRHVAEHGAVFAAKPRKKAGQWNPQWSVMRHCDEAIRHLETELGISPLRRQRAGKVQRRDTKKRASDAYLSKKTA